MANINKHKIIGSGEQSKTVAAWNTTHVSVNIVASSDPNCVFTVQVKFDGASAFKNADGDNSDVKLNESATFLLTDVNEVKIVPSVATARYEARVNTY